MRRQQLKTYLLRIPDLNLDLDLDLNLAFLQIFGARSLMSHFGHETLNVYQESIRFITWISELLETIQKNLSVHNQLDRASTSIPLNIAEGNGKHTSADRCRYFDIARGSALECAACLDVLVAKKKIDEDKVQKGKNQLYQIVSMLIGLIRANSKRNV